MKLTVPNQPPALIDLLQEAYPDCSKSTLRSWIKGGRIAVDGAVVTRTDRALLAAQSVTVAPKALHLAEEIQVLYEDEDVVVLIKPAGLLSVATEFKKNRTVHEILKRRSRGKRVFPVHRLDRDTSGVMVFTYHERSRDHLKEQFAQHGIEKLYYAIVEGKPESPKGTWESFLQEDAMFFVKSSESGKLAVTQYEEVAGNKRFTLLRLRPLTGRKNQLRVHCSEAGIPILGDEKYGAQTASGKRLFLHAQSLKFTHPTSGKRMNFSIPLPEEFRKIVKFTNLNI